jgi:hypothetical protein
LQPDWIIAGFGCIGCIASACSGCLVAVLTRVAAGVKIPKVPV